jgi:hypothetical protein
MSVLRRYGRSQQQRKRAALKSLNVWLNRPHETGVAKKVMNVIREGRALLDYMDRRGYFVQRLANGRLFHEPRIESADIEERAKKLGRLMTQLQFTLAIEGSDAMKPNALWLGIRPKTKSNGAWEHAKTLLFAIPSGHEDIATGDRDSWVALNNVMRISSEGNFPQRCSAPLPKEAGRCGNWFVKITPQQHACSLRCRQRKIEATAEYKEKKKRQLKEHRKKLKDRVQKELELVRRESQRRKKRWRG